MALYSYIAAVLFLRTSFLLLYLRLDRRIIMRWIVLALSPVVLTQTCSLVIGAAFSCAPPTLIWTTSIASSGRCWTSGSIQTFLNVSGILVSAVDASILAASLSMAGTRRGLRVRVLMCSCLEHLLTSPGQEMVRDRSICAGRSHYHR